ncbi:MAG: hypothetical protein GWO28_11715 [candidate division Zixibacteria bacterium]|nr:hypothetical protein [candidate division Zixibacteria bacterium]
MIRELGDEHTVLLSTHILSEAQQICDRVMIINNGKIVAEDSPEQLQLRLAGAQNVSISILGDEQKAEKIISSIDGVVNVNKSETGILEFETAPGEEVRPIVARSLIEQGIDILEMRSMGLSLEDIFLELTREQPVDINLEKTNDFEVEIPELVEEEKQDA